MLFVENARTAHTFDYKVILAKVKKDFYLKKKHILGHHLLQWDMDKINHGSWKG